MEKVNEIKDSDGNTIGYICDSEIVAMQNLTKRFYKKWLFYMDENSTNKSRARREANQDNRKFALVKIGNTRTLCSVDEKTNKAYRLDGYSFTWIEIPRFEFIRWATGFDV